MQKVRFMKIWIDRLGKRVVKQARERDVKTIEQIRYSDLYET